MDIQYTKPNIELLNIELVGVNHYDSSDEIQSMREIVTMALTQLDLTCEAVNLANSILTAIDDHKRVLG